MASRNHKNWLKEPTVEYISSECYSSQEIYEKEIKEIFAKVKQNESSVGGPHSGIR